MTTPNPTATEQELEKLKRRQKRSERAAFARGLVQGICSMLTPRDIVVDCGANVGAVTIELAQSGAHVHAFEPDPYAFEQLTKATSDHPNVTLHNAATGLEAGSARLLRADNFNDNPRGASVKSTLLEGGRKISGADENSVEVEVISLPDFLHKLHARHGDIAFLKMDIEGAELDILEHMLTENLFDLARLTVAETHEHKFKALRPRFRALRKAVAEKHPPTRVNLDWI